MNVDKWIDVVTNPLGLAGFAVFLVFLVVGRAIHKSEFRWLAPAFVTLALIALVGGIGLAWRSQPAPTPPVPEKRPDTAQKDSGTIDAKTFGDGSHIGIARDGNVNIVVGAPPGKDSPKAKPVAPEK